VGLRITRSRGLSASCGSAQESRAEKVDLAGSDQRAVKAAPKLHVCPRAAVGRPLYAGFGEKHAVAAGAHSRLTIRRIDAVQDFAKRVP
jgi:hypothetical protein